VVRKRPFRFGNIGLALLATISQGPSRGRSVRPVTSLLARHCPPFPTRAFFFIKVFHIEAAWSEPFQVRPPPLQCQSLFTSQGGAANFFFPPLTPVICEICRFTSVPTTSDHSVHMFFMMAPLSPTSHLIIALQNERLQYLTFRPVSLQIASNTTFAG